MIQSFADEMTADIFRERNTKAGRRIPKNLWRIVQRKLKMLDVAARIVDPVARPSSITRAILPAISAAGCSSR